MKAKIVIAKMSYQKFGATTFYPLATTDVKSKHYAAKKHAKPFVLHVQHYLIQKYFSLVFCETCIQEVHHCIVVFS